VRRYCFLRGQGCEEILFPERTGLLRGDFDSRDDRVVRRYCLLRGQGCEKILFAERTGL
jgi:hypothetical protein